MRIRLSDHFNYRRLLRFALPSVVMMVFNSIYTTVDGFSVSNFAGVTPFAAVLIASSISCGLKALPVALISSQRTFSGIPAIMPRLQTLCKAP